MLIHSSLKRVYIDEGGAISIITAIVLFFVFLGIAALAIDIGRVAATKNELQNAADAAALAKASFLYPPHNNEPNWDAAENANAPTNKADGNIINNYISLSGYWHLNGDYDELKSKNTSGSLLTQYDVPAVHVSVEKKAGSNNGAISNFFGGLIGTGESPVTTSSIATSYPPGSASPGQLFPVAIQKAVAENWHQYDEQNPVYIASAYHSDDPILAGQWTSLLEEANDVPTVRDLINNGNPDPVSTEDDIWIEPGTKNSLYYTVKSWLIDSPTQDEHGNQYRDVFLPVVEGFLDNKSAHEWRNVEGFVGARITYAEGRSERVIKAHFIEASMGGGGGGPQGPYYGTSIKPVIVQ